MRWSTSNVKLVFSALLLTQLAVNFDAGALPAVIPELIERFHTSSGTIGVINAMTYVGVVLGSFFAGWLFRRFTGAEGVPLVITMGCNTGCLVLLVLGLEYSQLWLLFVSKFLIGFTQATPAVYIPVWITQWAPPSVQVLWMGLVQAMTVAGIGVGYLVGAVFPQQQVVHVFATNIGVVSLVTLLLLVGVTQKSLLLIPSEPQPDSPKVLVPASSEESQTKEDMLFVGIRRASTVSLVKSLSLESEIQMKSGLIEPVTHADWHFMLSSVFLCSLTSVCCIYFVLTTIQSWSTIYLLEVIKASRLQTTTAFLVIATTAPTAGVVVGGILGDALSKGTDRVRLRLMSTLLLFSAIASACAVASSYVVGLWPFSISVWFTLFSGGLTVPSLYKLLIAYLSPEFRTAASTVILVATNVIGFALGAWLPGQIIAAKGTQQGFRVSMWLSLIGTSTFALATVRLTFKSAARKRDEAKRRKTEVELTAVEEHKTTHTYKHSGIASSSSGRTNSISEAHAVSV